MGTTKKQFGALRVTYALGVLLLAFFVVWLVNPGPDGPSLFARYFSPAEFQMNESLSDEQQNRWDKFEEFYTDQDYSTAAVVLGDIDVYELGPDDAVRFYSAQCGLASDPVDVQGALRELEEVLSVEGPYHSMGNWYAALAYCYQNEFEKAEAMLNQISADNPGAYPAKELISEID